MGSIKAVLVGQRERGISRLSSIILEGDKTQKKKKNLETGNQEGEITSGLGLHRHRAELFSTSKIYSTRNTLAMLLSIPPDPVWFFQNFQDTPLLDSN